eukprot:12597263-Alexandrium_andersonii.AAC.1
MSLHCSRTEWQPVTVLPCTCWFQGILMRAALVQPRAWGWPMQIGVAEACVGAGGLASSVHLLAQGALLATPVCWCAWPVVFVFLCASLFEAARLMSSAVSSSAQCPLAVVPTSSQHDPCFQKQGICPRHAMTLGAVPGARGSVAANRGVEVKNESDRALVQRVSGHRMLAHPQFVPGSATQVSSSAFRPFAFANIGPMWG